ncbi:MAG: Hpt domain-containing protein, partial [Pseudomonadota bacterium]|nr:Hpt domain-containing protein [Pseudomonadota bacterium]
MSFPKDRGSDDLSALAWVHEELRRSLDAAHKALRRYVREMDALSGSDIDAVDPAVLRAARAQIHQGVGALELVGQPAAAMVLRASEALVQRVVAKPHKLTVLVVEDIERASFALLDYLSRLLAGKHVSTLALFPSYRAVLEAAGADRVHPADLWQRDWQWHDLPSEAGVAARQHDAATQAAIEAELLPLMRGADPVGPAVRLGDLCAGLGAGAETTQVATLWKLAAAVFEAQARGLLGFDVFSKRVASRLLAQFRILARGESDVSERLAQDLLFFCAQSNAPAEPALAPRLSAVRAAYGLADTLPIDYTVSVLGRFDPAVIAQAKKRVITAKDAWSGVAGGEMHRMTGLSEQFALVGESLKKLFPLGETLAAQLQHAVAQTQQSGAAPPAPLAMEVATSLLYVEAALDDADFDHPDQAGRVRRLAERLAAVRQGQPPAPLEGWMEELYRRVSDRQTMGSVVHELRASLSEVEKQIDSYFRTPAERQLLIPVPGQLQAMRGVLSVLGMDHAAAALLRMRDSVDALATTEVDTAHLGDTGVFDRLAGNLGALGFLIDMLSVQPQMAKSLFTFDAETGTLEPVMGRSADATVPPLTVVSAPPAVEPRLIEQAQMLAFSSVREDVPLADVTRDLERLGHEAHAADQPALAAATRKAREAIDQASDPAGVTAARGELSETLVDFVASSTEPIALEPVAAPVPAPAPEFALSTRSAELAQDDEMREIFLEEANEVLGDARAAIEGLAGTPDDLDQLTTLRRAFHTLKGSSRMVGLKEFGEGAWVCEQLYNGQLAEQAAAPQALIDFTTWSLDYLGAWVEEIAARRVPTHHASRLVEAARLTGEAPPPPLESQSTHDDLAPSPAPDAPAFALTETASFGDAADSAAPTEMQDLAFALTEVGGFNDPSPAAAPTPVDALGGLTFELDLDSLDAPPEKASEAERAAPPPALDLAAAELQALFDAPTQPLPLLLPEVIEDSAGVDLVLDLDLGAPAAAAPQATPAFGPDFASSRAMNEPFEAAPAATQAPHSEFGTEPEPEPEPLTEPASGPGRLDDELVKIVGPLRIGIPLFNIYLSEADELSRRLGVELAEWAMELHRPIGDTPIALAHSLAGNSATVGFTDLSHLARLLEHAQARSLAIGHGTPEEARLFVDTADEIRRLLHQFAAGFLKTPSPELLQRLAEHELSSARRLEAAAAAAELAPISSPGELPGRAADDTTEFPADAPFEADAGPAAEVAPQTGEASAPPTDVGTPAPD